MAVKSTKDESVDLSRWLLHFRMCCCRVLLGRWNLRPCVSRPQLGNRRLAKFKGPGAIQSEDMHACYTSPIFH